MTKEQYCETIREILDQAAGDKSLSMADYMDICSWVEDDAQSRRIAGEADLEEQENSEG